MSQRLQLPACHAYDYSLSDGSYGYQPSLAPGIAFSVLFGIACCILLFQCIRSRAWYQLLFVIGAMLECAGWIARTASHPCPYSDTLFTMQISVLIMGPAWIQAGIYFVAWRILCILGPELSPVPAKVYLITTVCFDVVTLTLQAAGGGLAGSAYDNGSNPQPGTTTMVVGIIMQLVIGVVFLVFFMVVFLKGRQRILKSSKLSLTSLVSFLVMLTMIWRGVYRSIELLEGWTGYLITTERYFIALDGVPMVIASFLLCILNPGLLLRQPTEEKRASMEKILPSDSDSDAQVVKC